MKSIFISRSVEELPAELRASAEKMLARLETKYGERELGALLAVDAMRQLIVLLPKNTQGFASEILATLSKFTLQPLGFTQKTATEAIVEIGKWSNSISAHMTAVREAEKAVEKGEVN